MHVINKFLYQTDYTDYPFGEDQEMDADEEIPEDGTRIPQIPNYVPSNDPQGADPNIAEVNYSREEILAQGQ